MAKRKTSETRRQAATVRKLEARIKRLERRQDETDALSLTVMRGLAKVVRALASVV